MAIADIYLDKKVETVHSCTLLKWNNKIVVKGFVPTTVLQNGAE